MKDMEQDLKKKGYFVRKTKYIERDLEDLIE